MKTFNEWVQDEKLKRLERAKKKVSKHRDKQATKIRDEREAKLEKKRAKKDKEDKMRERSILKKEVEREVRQDIEYLTGNS